MTRLGRTVSRDQFDLAEAFRFLGKAPSYRELGLAADLLRESGVEVNYDERLRDLAVANGSSALDALDLATATALGVEALCAGPQSDHA